MQYHRHIIILSRISPSDIMSLAYFNSSAHKIILLYLNLIMLRYEERTFFCLSLLGDKMTIITWIWKFKWVYFIILFGINNNMASILVALRYRNIIMGSIIFFHIPLNQQQWRVSFDLSIFLYWNINFDWKIVYILNNIVCITETFFMLWNLLCMRF